MTEADKEKKEFLKLCGERDRNFLMNPKTMSFGEFDRLTYIISFLGFQSYHIELWNQLAFQYKEQLEYLDKLLKFYESEISQEILDSEIYLYDMWLIEFIENAPTKVKQKLKRTIQQFYDEHGWEFPKSGEVL